jgi:hypothetical protein
MTEVQVADIVTVTEFKTEALVLEVALPVAIHASNMYISNMERNMRFLERFVCGKRTQLL